jgi:hypothetical protein
MEEKRKSQDYKMICRFLAAAISLASQNKKLALVSALNATEHEVEPFDSTLSSCKRHGNHP